MEENPACTIVGCKNPGVTVLHRRSFCGEHFIATCHARIEEFNRRLQERPFRNTNVDSVRQFVVECGQKASELARQESDPAELARLSEIRLWASNLAEHLRRSPRTRACFPMRLVCQGPADSWEEETATLTVSRYGAAVKCQHTIEIGQTLVAVRTDTGRRAQARVASRQSGAAGGQQIAIEFEDCDNFWELNWDVFDSEATGD